MVKLLLIGSGGFAGAILRYLLSSWVSGAAGDRFPWGTFAVNLLGCFAIGALWMVIQQREWLPQALAPLLITGFLGGFTTFSAFGLETLALLDAGRYPSAFAYSTSSVVLGVAAVWFGRMVFET